MTEFEQFKALLDRIEHVYTIEEWEAIDEAWIDDLTEKVTFEFIGGKLVEITNNK